MRSGFGFAGQPIVDLRDKGKLWGEELLFRCPSNVPPDVLFQAVRHVPDGWELWEAGLVREALKVAHPHVFTTVNVTGSTFLTLTPDVFPENVGVEIVEWGEMIPTDQIAAHTKMFSESGVLVFLDDFGTAQSGIQRIGAAPWAGIKFDMSWVGMPKTMTKPVVEAVRSMLPDALIIAEGIETAAENETVSEWADLCQGFFWGRPGVPRSATF